MEKKRIFLLLVLIVLFLDFVAFVSAENIIGVSPANIYFSKVLRGGYAQRSVYVSLDSENTMQASVTPLGEIKDWIGFPYKNFSVSRQNPYRFLMYVEPPLDMPNGNYTGFLRFTIHDSDLRANRGEVMGKIITVIDVAITVEVTDIEIFSCSAKSFEISSAEKGEKLIIRATTYNGGNVRIKPQFNLDIWDQDQANIVKNVSFRQNEI